MAKSNTKGSLSLTSSPATPRPNQAASVSDEIATASNSPSVARGKKAPRTSEDFENSFQMNLAEEMEEEKLRFPGASSWAPDEERLFEILYLRQDLPMLPPTWDYDLSDVPISDAIFQTSEQFPPIIYAHDKDFRATMALMRMIDLTAKVRSSFQCGSRQKVPGLIKRELDRYISWAAQDGNYSHLRIVPNIVTEVIDTTIPREDITEYIQDRMQALGRLQREFLQENRDPEFWDVTKPSLMTSPNVKAESEEGSPDWGKWPAAAPKKFNADLNPDELSVESPTLKRSPKVEDGSKKRRLFPSPTSSDIDELAEDELTEGPTEGPPRKKIKLEKGSVKKCAKSISSYQPNKSETPKAGRALKRETPRLGAAERQTPKTKTPKRDTPKAKTLKLETPTSPTYRRHPPVVYGLFILNTSVLLLTTDASRGGDSYVSFHIQVNFSDRRQSVWNALTMAIAVCRARDDLMTRSSDFKDILVIQDSDPDA
ncbi:hypothetical protein B0T10DRAFT_225346 [Thelonectria olida]|uniref:Uncharacterized protein n=1 Tax=Thelonectria olida TaxID=1576542 RepID=A0A9P9AWG8_9HYPO|nr:hypothetical protein B0T10DRAFT_225346 [Thelonectria olida]